MAGMRQVLRLSGGLLLALVAGVAVWFAGAGPVRAQDDSGCAAIYQAAMTEMMAHCFTVQPGTACGVSADVVIEMDSGQVVSGAGSTARLSGVAALRALPGDGTAWSLASLAVPDSLNSALAARLVVLGPAELRFVPDADRPPGAAFTLTSPADPFPCSGLARPGVLVQSPPNSLTLLRVNGVELAVNGTAVIHALDGGLTVSALTRETILAQSGTVVFAGYSAQATGDTASEAVPYDPAAVAHLPIEILPEMHAVALPGSATLQQTINLYQRPAPEAYTNTLAKAGLPVAVFGRSSDGQWLHVRTYDGQMGWLPAGALDVRVPVEIPVYDSAPPAPVRPFGAIQGYVVTSAEHNNLRDGPGERYAIVQTVPLLTELALYGRSADNQWLLVETPDGLRAWINVVLISQSTPYTLSELPYPPGFEP